VHHEIGQVAHCRNPVDECSEGCGDHDECSVTHKRGQGGREGVLEVNEEVDGGREGCRDEECNMTLGRGGRDVGDFELNEEVFLAGCSKVERDREGATVRYVSRNV